MIITGIGEKLPFETGHFDVLFCNQVVEHVQNLEEVLNEILRVCKKGGDVYLARPNYLIPLEYHYRVWLLPWLPKKLSAKILTFLGKKPYYLLCCINFINPFQILRIFNKIGNNKIRNIVGELLKSPELIRSKKYVRFSSF